MTPMLQHQRNSPGCSRWRNTRLSDTNNQLNQVNVSTEPWQQCRGLLCEQQLAAS
jgi:hypothetical protein